MTNVLERYYARKVFSLEQHILLIQQGGGDYAELLHLRRALESARRGYAGVPQEATLPEPVHDWKEEGF